jgi:hypothetical protein
VGGSGGKAMHQQGSFAGPSTMPQLNVWPHCTHALIAISPGCVRGYRSRLKKTIRRARISVILPVKSRQFFISARRFA